MLKLNVNVYLPEEITYGKKIEPAIILWYIVKYIQYN